MKAPVVILALACAGTSPLMGQADLGARQTALVVEYSAFQSGVLQAQESLATALGLKEAAAQAQAAEGALKSGNLDQDQVPRVSATSEAVDREMDSIRATSPHTDNALYARGVVVLAAAVMGGRGLPADASAFADAAKTAATQGNPFQRAKVVKSVRTGAAIAKSAPAAVSAAIAALKSGVAYLQSQNAPVPPEATQALGSL